MNTPRVLVVEDDPFTLDLLNETLTSEHFLCTCVTHGNKAWDCLLNDSPPYDIILLDRGLPDMDGIDILHRRMSLPKSKQVPVVVQSSRSSTSDIEQGLQAGAYYYLVKPFSPDTLVAILTAAIRDHKHQYQLREQVQLASRSLVHLRNAEFQFQSMGEVQDIASLLAKATPKAEQVVLGLAELMTNAVEHGNLGISYQEKGALLLSGEWHMEIERRALLPENANKWATLHYERTAEGFQFTVHDQGSGFEWEHYLQFSPERAFDLHGRGIAISAGSCFDRLEYRGIGNEVEAFLAG